MDGQPISWVDLNSLYEMTQIPFDSIPLIGSRIAGYLGEKDLSQIIEDGANSALNPRGIDFVARRDR